MTMVLIGGPIYGDASQDKEGYRDYSVSYIAQSSDPTNDGPANALQTPGLPTYGSILAIRNNIDVYVWRRLDTKVRKLVDKEASAQYLVECVYSSKPPENKRCQDEEIKDPLLIPPKVSGSYSKYQEEAVDALEVTHLDSTGAVTRTLSRLVNSAFEQMRGSQVEFDKNRMQITIQQNVATASQGYQLPAQLIDHVNQTTLWGLPARSIKLSDAPWEKKFYGTCSYYYDRTLKFDVSIKADPFTGELVSGFDKNLLDEGTKVLRGQWLPTGSPVTYEWGVDTGADAENPKDYVRFKDIHGENCRVLLNGHGQPALVSASGVVGDPECGTVKVKKYFAADFLSLGIPTTF